MSRNVCCLLLLVPLLLGVGVVHADAQPQSLESNSPATAADPLDRPLVLDQTDKSKNAPSAQPKSQTVGLTMTTIVGGLAICLGIFLLVVVLTRRNSTNKFGPLPSEVIESLGRMNLNQRQQLQLIRLGRMLVLLNVTAQGTTAVCEIDDPDEVTRIAGLCQQGQPNSVTATFREVLGQFGPDTETVDYYETVRPAESARSSLVRTRHPTREGFHG